MASAGRLAARVIPCLDVRDGRVVKGVRFVDIRDAGDPVEAAARYEQEGADELCMLDITATHEGREAMLAVVTEVARQLTIPLTVGGGVSDLDSFSRLLGAGADKVSVNSAALARPGLLSELAAHYGAQCVVLAVDARRVGDGWRAHTHGGRRDSGVDALEWCERAAGLGAGEILLTSMDADGTKDGFATDLLAGVAARSALPLIASGGAGSLAHFAPALAAGADAVLAASVFHDRTFTVGEVKQALREAGHAIRRA